MDESQANYTQKVIRGTGWVFFMTMIGTAIAYVMRVILARKFTPAEYGLFYSVFTVITLTLFIRDLGLNQALVKYIAEFKVQEKYTHIKTVMVSVLAFQLASSTVFAAVAFLGADFLAVHFFKDPAAAIILKGLLLYLFGSVLYKTIRSTFQAFQKMRIYSITEPLKNGATLILLLIFLYFGFGLQAAVYAYAIVCFLLVLLLFLPFLKTFPFFNYKITEFGDLTKKLFLFGVPVFATAIAGKVISDIDTVMLTYFRSLSEVGVYNVVLPSAEMFFLFSATIGEVIFPMAVELWTKKDLKRLADGVRLLYRYAFAVVVPPALAVIVFSNFLITLFFGEKYIAGALALQILMMGMLIYVVAGLNLNIIAATGRPKAVAKIIILAAITNIVVNLFLIPRFGIEGAAFATSLSYLVILILSTLELRRYIPLEIPTIPWLKLLFAGGIFIGTIYSLLAVLALNQWLEIVLSLLTASIAYIVIIYYTKAVDISEIKRYYVIFRK